MLADAPQPGLYSPNLQHGTSKFHVENPLAKTCETLFSSKTRISPKKRGQTPGSDPNSWSRLGIVFGAEVYREVQQGILPKWCFPVAAHGLHLSNDFLSDPSLGSCSITSLLLRLQAFAFGVLAPPTAGTPSPAITLGKLGPCMPPDPPGRWGQVEVRILGTSGRASFEDATHRFSPRVLHLQSKCLEEFLR